MVGGPQEECLHRPYFDVLADLFYRHGWGYRSYGFLCFYRIIEGILKMCETRAVEGVRRRYDNEKVEGERVERFDKEFHGKKFGYVVEKMTPARDRLAHTFFDKKGIDSEELGLDKRIELEARLGQLRSQAREMVKVMMHSEYWSPSSPRE